MGIRDLSKFIEPCGEIVHYKKFERKYIVVDAFQKIYKYCNSHSERQNMFNNHLKAITNCIHQLSSHNIIPIFVFDGASIHVKTQYKLRKSSDDDITKQNKSSKYKNTFKISPKQIKDCETLINYFGLQFIRAPFEADSQCAVMTYNDVSTVLTDDTDIMTFGSKSMLKMIQMQFVDTLKELFVEFLNTKPKSDEKYSIYEMMTIVNNRKYSDYIKNRVNIHVKYDLRTIYDFSSKETINFAVEYDKKNVFEYIKNKTNDILIKYHKPIIDEFTQDNFIELCILFGTDYQQKICNMSVNEIFEMYVLCDMNIEKCIEFIKIEKQFNVSEDYLDNFRDIKEYYHRASVIDPNTIDYNIYKPNECELYKYLMGYGFSYTQTTSIIKFYRDKYYNIKQLCECAD
jgi:hypothetical protein